MRQNEIIHLKYLAQHVAHGKKSIQINYYWLLLLLFQAPETKMCTLMIKLLKYLENAREEK